MTQVHNVAKRFSNAAMQYGRHARVQARTADYLLRNSSWSGCVLDLGCGPGREARYLAALPQVEQVLALDLADGMLAALGHEPFIQAIQADMHCLPLDAQSVDKVFSNFAMQWCHDTEVLARELFRVLKPAGSLHAGIPVPGSLAALEMAGLAVNAFWSVGQWRDAFAKAGFSLHMTEEVYRDFYESPRELLQALKNIGANTRLQSASSVLRGREWWKRTQEALEETRRPEGFALEYVVVFIHAYKSPESNDGHL